MSELDAYDYPLEESNIALTPAHPRDSAKLLVYNRAGGEITTDTFANIGTYLPEKALLILNDTKVIPARLVMHDERGRDLAVLFTRLDKGFDAVECLIPKHCDDGAVLTFSEGTMTVLSKKDGVYTAKLECTGNIYDVLQREGTTPIPPYLKATTLEEQDLREEYQAVWAKYAGSAAAPTASLHFTEGLLEKLKAQGIEIAYVTLHVGLGTFAPVTDEHLRTGTLHKEWFEVPAATITAIEKAKAEGRAVIPVGTTALRTIESYAISHTYHNCDEYVISGETDLFIRPGYTFKRASALITNFHVPKSSLLMLVAALVGKDKLFELYAFAQRNRFRFLSFGDGMLIL